MFVYIVAIFIVISLHHGFLSTRPCLVKKIRSATVVLVAAASAILLVRIRRRRLMCQSGTNALVSEQSMLASGEEGSTRHGMPPNGTPLRGGSASLLLSPMAVEQSINSRTHAGPSHVRATQSLSFASVQNPLLGKLLSAIGSSFSKRSLLDQRGTSPIADALPISSTAPIGATPTATRQVGSLMLSAMCYPLQGAVAFK